MIIRRRLPRLASLLVVAAVCSYGQPTVGAKPPAKSNPWRPLLGGNDFAGWYTWLETSGRNSDPTGIFKFEDGAVHVYATAKDGSKQPYGYFATDKELSNYHLRFQYKWGRKKFIPRYETKRDAGLMYHVFGPDLLWPTCIECQVQETDTGDFVMVGTTLTIELGPPAYGYPKYAPGGKPRSGLKWHVLNRGEYNDPPEDSLTDWNTVEVIVTDGALTHIVNGKVNNYGVRPMRPDPQDPSREIPLTRGRILFQAEGAEVIYRNIEIKPAEADPITTESRRHRGD